MYSIQANRGEKGSIYDQVIQLNPQLRSKFDFKSILFSDRSNSYTPEESQDIYSGKKPIRLATQVKYKDGRLELMKKEDSEILSIINKLKGMKGNFNSRDQNNGGLDQQEYDDDYYMGEDEEDYNEWENEEDYNDADGYGDIDDLEGYDQDEEAFYQNMMREMEDEMERDIAQEMRRGMMQGIMKKEQFDKQKALPSSKEANSDSQQKPDKKGKKADEDEGEEEEEWETGSEDNDDDEDDDNDEDNQEDEGFSSIKVPSEDYSD